MARQVRSGRAPEGVIIQRLRCAWCRLAWTRAPRPGTTPRFCSNVCRQASWRAALGREEYSRRRKAAPARGTRGRQVAIFQDELERITATTPLSPGRAVPLLNELAGTDPSQDLPVSRLYRTAATIWHPDLEGGDHKVFQLLQEAHRVARAHPA